MFGGGFFDDFLGDMMDPFNMFGGRRQRRNQMQLAAQQNVGYPGFAPMMPFGFPDIGGMMSQMEHAMRDPTNFSGPGFVSHSMVQMSFDGTGTQPQIYQESSTTRQAADGVRETRRTVTDTFTGTKQMSIGHHMHGRGRVIERKQDLNTQELEENEELINLDEEEKDTFEREWQQRATMGQRHAMNPRDAIMSGRPGQGQRSEMLALPAPGPSSRPSHQRRPRGPHNSSLHGSHDRRGSHVTDVSPGASHSHHSGHVRPSSAGRRQRREHRRNNH